MAQTSFAERTRSLTRPPHPSGRRKPPREGARDDGRQHGSDQRRNRHPGLANAGRPLALAELGLLSTGIGMALNTGPLLAVAVRAVEPPRARTAPALVNTARMVGASFGVAVLGAVYAEVGSTSEFALAMRLGATVAFLGAALAVTLIHG